MPNYTKSNERLNSIKWSEIFEYTKESASFLRWKHKRKARNNSLVNRSNNNQAGGINSENYLSLNYEKNLYSIPKIIWIMHNGPIPDGYSVYFKDHDKLNASIENLYLRETYLKLDEKYSDSLKDYLQYDESSPSGLRWISKASKSSKIANGDVVGSLDEQDGYWKLHGLGHSYKIHRIIWFLHNGKIPKGLWIDHINGNRSDNRIINLRIVVPALNGRNRTMSKNNNIGYTGISYYEGFNHRGTLIRRYTVSVVFNGKWKTRGFSCVKYGDDLALKLAIETRDKLIDEVNKQGAGYTDRHGK
jgi:hypothetical protein